MLQVKYNGVAVLIGQAQPPGCACMHTYRACPRVPTWAADLNPNGNISFSSEGKSLAVSFLTDILDRMAKLA